MFFDLFEYSDYSYEIRGRISSIKGQLSFTNDIIGTGIDPFEIIVPSDIIDLIQKVRILQINCDNDCAKKLFNKLIDSCKNFIADFPNVNDEKYMEDVSTIENLKNF